MSERKRVFLTGATGFVGSHLASRLLLEGHRVGVLVRESKGVSARERIESVLQDIGAQNMDALEVFEGDISVPNLGLSDSALNRAAGSTAEVWHCAASLSFLPEDRDEIFKMNVGGTRNILDFVERTPTRRLHHVSTAYVAGNRPDLALETDINVGQTFKNPYEESKCESEILVAEAHKHGRAVASVYRPSIVIGDSRSGRATHFHGVYAFIRGLWAALERLRRGMPEGEVVNLPLRLVGAEEGTLNFVPINYVIDGMIAIAKRADSVGRTYNLVNPVPTPNRMWLQDMCNALRVEGIHFVTENSFLSAPMTRLEQIFQKQMAFYYQYLQGEPRFDNSRTIKALEHTGIECPRIDSDFVQKMMGWYLEFLKAER